nr:reverse transcriptase domain-containing protein [Tanacetum cinerariifolium]
MTLELPNRDICTPAGIARDVFVSVGKFTFPADFVIVDYESDLRVPLILGRPFLRTTHVLIDVHREEMILRDGDERLTLNMRHDTSSYSNQPQKESINMINIYDDSCKDYLEYLFATNHQSRNPTFSTHHDLTSLEVKDDIFDPEGDILLIEKLLNLESTKDLPPPHNINPLSGSTTSSSDHLLEEFVDELAFITFSPGNDDLPLDIKSDLREIEYLLNHDPTKEMDSILEDSVDECNLIDPNVNLVDIIPEMFTYEHDLDYSSPLLYHDLDDDLDEFKFDNNNAYNNPFDSKEEKIKESKLLIDELDPLKSSDFLPSPECDSFLFEDFSKVDALPLTNNEDKVFNLELLRAPTEGYAGAIVVPPILAEHFELKHSLINMMTSDQFFELEKDNPHDHIRWNEITNFQQCFDESLCAAWERFEDLPRACPHHGFTEFHQIDTFYNSLMSNDQDSLNAAAGGNRLTKTPREALTLIETALNYNQGNTGYRLPSVADKVRPPGYPPNMMASFFQMNTASTLGSGPLPSNTIANPKGKLKVITTRSGIVLDKPSVHMPPPFINPEKDECVEETLTDPELGEFTIKVPPPFVQKAKPPCQRNYVVHQRDHLYPNIPYPSRIELKCKALADLGASIKLMPLSVWKKLVLPELISTRMTLELANWAFCTPARIARDVFVSVGKFTFPANFVIVDYESDPRVLLILGRPFLRTDRALIDVHGEEMILRDGDERLTLNMRHDTSSYSNQAQKESTNMINIYDDSCEDYLEDLFAINHQSGDPTFSSHPDLTSSKVKDDIFDPGGDIVLIKILLNLDSTKDLPPSHNINPLSRNSVDECNLVDTIPEMFTDEHALNYSSPPLYDDFDDDLDEFESDNDNAYNDPFDSKDEKIKESKLLIDELDPFRSSDFLPSFEYDSFLFEDFSEVDPLPSTNNEDKVFNPAISHASLILEDFDPPFYELPFHKEVPRISWILKTRDCGFILQSLDLHILSFILGIQYTNLID